VLPSLLAVEMAGFAPATFRLQGGRSTELSYIPVRPQLRHA
jgi:hypothetical protein